MSAVEVCEHCGHAWQSHVGDRCACGCMWTDPAKAPKPPPPPSPRELLAGRIVTAIFDELDRQHEADGIDGAGYWDREWGCLDGEPDWGRVAHSLIDAFEIGDDS